MQRPDQAPADADGPRNGLFQDMRSEMVQEIERQLTQGLGQILDRIDSVELEVNKILSSEFERHRATLRRIEAVSHEHRARHKEDMVKYLLIQDLMYQDFGTVIDQSNQDTVRQHERTALTVIKVSLAAILITFTWIWMVSNNLRRD